MTTQFRYLLILLLSITAGCATGKYTDPEIPVREVVISWP